MRIVRSIKSGLKKAASFVKNTLNKVFNRKVAGVVAKVVAFATVVGGLVLNVIAAIVGGVTAAVASAVLIIGTLFAAAVFRITQFGKQAMKVRQFRKGGMAAAA